MDFLVTARKWRPQKFEELVGQEHIAVTIKNAIKNNRIAHAYLFAGPRGIGKTTTARIFAKVLNCTNPKDGEPCNECDMCKSFNNSQSLDIIEIDGASNRRIEEIRSLRESVKYAPTKGKYKVYIIDEVHMLTTESFNALLKTLEEPPAQTIFIFATTDVHKVPATIISRCQRFDFRRIETNTIKETLNKIAKAEKIKIDDHSLTIIAKKADGALRDAESLFDQVVSFCGTDVKGPEVARMLNLINDEIYFEISDAILNKDYQTAFTISQKIYQNGWNYIDFLNGIVEHFRNILTVIVSKDTKLLDTSEESKSKYKDYEESFSEGDILRILAYLNKVQYEIRSSQNPKLKIEVSLCHLIGLEKSSTITELIAKAEKNIQPQESKKKVVKSSGHREQSVTAYNSTAVMQNHTADPIDSGEINLEYINNNWIKFVEIINQQKFTLGSHLANSIPVLFSSGKITVKLPSNEEVEILGSNKSYLKCLEENSEEFFKQKIKFDFTHAGKTSDTFQTKHEQSISNIDTNLSTEESSFISAIIKELGGREIGR